jgi:hypothetical protein
VGLAAEYLSVVQKLQSSYKSFIVFLCRQAVACKKITGEIGQYMQKDINSGFSEWKRPSVVITLVMLAVGILGGYFNLQGQVCALEDNVKSVNTGINDLPEKYMTREETSLTFKAIEKEQERQGKLLDQIANKLNVIPVR